MSPFSTLLELKMTEVVVTTSYNVFRVIVKKHLAYFVVDMVY